MTTGLYLVFSNPPASVDEEEFNVFQSRHNQEVLEVPGFFACRRYRLARLGGEQFPSRFGSVSAYEVDRGPGELREALRVTAADRDHPEWWGSVDIIPVMCERIAGDPDPTARDRFYLTFNSPRDGAGFEQYSEWYEEHAAENKAASDRIDSVWRYRVSSPQATTEVFPQHLAAYSLNGPAAEMLAQTHAAMELGAVGGIDAVDRFASFEATALSDRKTEEG